MLQSLDQIARTPRTLSMYVLIKELQFSDGSNLQWYIGTEIQILIMSLET
jgi:hypothetical protein